MRHVIGVTLIAVSTVSVVLGQHHIYVKGSEVNANQGLFLAMPTNNFPTQTVGPLTVKVQAPTVGGPIGNYGSAGLLELTQPDVPFWVGIWLINSGSVAIQGTLHVNVIDEWRAEPSGPILFEVAPKVRNYWSLHDLMRALALRRMEYVEFVGDNIHHQQILWDGGGQVVVNRGESDWQVDGHTLPQYGFYASVKQRQSRVEAAVEKKGGRTAEWSRSEDITYVNGRGVTTDFGAVETAGAARLTRDGDSLMVTALPDGGNFTLRLQWSQLPWNIPPPRLAEALGENRNVIGKENLASSSGMVELKYNGTIFAYRLR